MLKSIALIYTVMLNGYNQWINNLLGGKSIETSVLLSVLLALKMPLNKYQKIYTVCVLFVH